MQKFDESFRNQNQRNYVEFAEGQHLDAAGRLRVSLPKILSLSKFEYSKETHAWYENLVNGGTTTHLPWESNVLLSVTSTAGSKVTKQTKDYHQYQPGNSQREIITVIFGPHESGIIKRAGYFDDDDGFYFEQSGGKYWLVLRTRVSGTVDDTTYRVEQKDWNVNTFQKLGSDWKKNPSGKNYDFSKMTVMLGDFLWLGGDRVRPAFKIDGTAFSAHEFFTAGLLDTPYWTSPCKPTRYEIINIGGTNSGSMKMQCSTVRSEGGEEVFGIQQVARRSFYQSKTVTDTSATGGAFTPILSIQPKQQFYGKDFRGIIVPIEYEIFVEGNFPIEYGLFHDATLTGAVWTDVKATGPLLSATEQDISATAMVGVHDHNYGWATGDVKGIPTESSEFQTPIHLSNWIYVTDRDKLDRYTIGARSKGGNATVAALFKLAEVY